MNIPSSVKAGIQGAVRAAFHGAFVGAGSLYFGLKLKAALGMMGIAALVGAAHFVSDHYFTDQGPQINASNPSTIQHS